MSYMRKTKDEYLLLANYGYGWDIVEIEESLKRYLSGQENTEKTPTLRSRFQSAESTYRRNKP